MAVNKRVSGQFGKSPQSGHGKPIGNKRGGGKGSSGGDLSGSTPHVGSGKRVDSRNIGNFGHTQMNVNVSTLGDGTPVGPNTVVPIVKSQPAPQTGAATGRSKQASRTTN